MPFHSVPVSRRPCRFFCFPPPAPRLSVLAGTVIVLLMSLLLSSSQVVVSAESLAPSNASNYPPDPTHDIVWGGGTGRLADIIANFNRARRIENSQLGTFIPDMQAPAASVWNAMTPAERALWLINQERTARGIAPLHGLEKNVTEVAQAYAEWLLANNKWGHYADGRDPKARLNDKPAIKACQDFLGVSENLAWVGTTDLTGFPAPVEYSVYMWIYDDAKYNWGHRHAVLWKSFTENSGPGDREGFLGIGHARGPYTGQTTQGPKFYPYTDMVVMNVFDPCSTWAYAAPPKPPEPPAPPPVDPPPPAPDTHKVSGVVAPPRWVTISNQTFEPGAWPGGWEASDADGAKNGHYHWIASTCRVYAGTYSGMAVGGGADGGVLGCSDYYPNYARSWLIYGPFSLADAIAAEMRSMVWVYTEPYHDMLCMLASLDRQNFNGPCVSGYSGSDANPTGWVGELFDLNRVYRMGSLLGKDRVYVAFAFITNENNVRPHMGAYVDNIVVQKAIRQPAQAADEAGIAAAMSYAGVMVSSDKGPYTVTDRNGAFVLQGLKPGRHVLTFSMDGHTFYPPRMELDVNRDLSGITVIGSTTSRHFTYLPTLRRSSARAAAIPEGVTVSEHSFRLECEENRCSLVGPLD